MRNTNNHRVHYYVHDIEELKTCRNELGAEKQETQRLRTKDEQTSSIYTCKIRIEQLKDCQANLDGKKQELKQLHQQHEQTNS